MSPKYKKALFVIIILAIVGSIVYLEAIKPHQGPATTVLQTIENESSTPAIASDTNEIAGSQTSTPAAAGAGTSLTPAQFLASRSTIVKQEEAKYPSAAEITDPSGWINTQPFTLSSLVGKKVVLLDFWTYSCINCIRTIPYLNAWYQKYKNAGLVIVGIHTPEFQFEHDYNNVSAAVKQLGIQYPVVLDNNMGTWNAYQNLYWPHEYLINIDGFVVHDNIGEGNYNETEAAIQAALTDRAQALGLPASIVPTGMSSPSGTIAINYGAVQTPETYFGAERNAYLANGPTMTNGTYTLTIPSSTTGNGFYLGGTWDFEDQYATNKTANAEILYQYNAKNLYMVASASQPVTAQVLVDGKPISPSVAGSDVSAQGTVTFQANRLYNIINGSGYDTHTIELIVNQPGLQAYTFTFG